MQHPDDLAFVIGDEVVVIDNSDASWYSGYLLSDPAHTVGTFPANFVGVKPDVANAVDGTVREHHYIA
jgi:hypothetical protein